MNIFTAIGQFFTNWGAKLASTFLEDDRYMMLVEGLRNTAIITLGALCIGIVIGALVAIIKYCGEGNPAMKPLCVLCDIYTTVIRGIPVVVLLLIFYFVIMKSASGISGGIAVGIVTFGINSGAYVSEIVRSGLMSVDPGQMEAGRSLGLNYFTTMRFIVIPQAVKNILPALGNEFITLLKDTSLITVIGGKEMTYAAKAVIAKTYQGLFPLFGIALMYLLLVMLFSKLLGVLERRLRQSDRR